MSPARGYKIRQYVNSRAKNGTEHKNYSLTVPGEIAEALPPDLKFVPRMTDEGLLFIPLNQANQQIELPNWAKEGNGKKSKSEPRSKAA
jgi:hypothetical protein